MSSAASYKGDITQGYDSRCDLGREEYFAIVSNPHFRAARAAHARALPEAAGKQDFAEYLAVGCAIDFSMAQIAEKLAAGSVRSDSVGFKMFMDRKRGVSAIALPAAVAVKSSADLWAEVIAEQNREIAR